MNIKTDIEIAREANKLPVQEIGSNLGVPNEHLLPVREVRISAGAGFIVVGCGEFVTMPGLPRKPAAETIRVNANGEIERLF